MNRGLLYSVIFYLAIIPSLCVGQQVELWRADFNAVAVPANGQCGTTGAHFFGVQGGRLRVLNVEQGGGGTCCTPSTGRGAFVVLGTTIPLQGAELISLCMRVEAAPGSVLEGTPMNPGDPCDPALDFVRLQYSLGGNWITAAEVAGPNVGTISSPPIATNGANNISVRLWVRTTSGDPDPEEYIVDNVILKKECPQTSVNTEPINPSCGSNDGSIKITRTPMTNFEYSINGGPWLGPGSSVTIPGLMAGQYSIRTRDPGSNDCITPPFQVTLTDGGPAQQNPVVTDASCNTDNGSIDFSGSSSGFNYELNGVRNGSGMFMDLFPGTYSVRIENEMDQNCFIDQLVTVGEDVPFMIQSPAVIQSPDCGGDNGQIQINVSGVTTNLSYKIEPIDSTYDPVGPYNNNAMPANLAEGTYRIYVRDNSPNFCVDTISFTLNTPQPVISSIQATALNCAANRGTIEVDAQSPTGDQLEYSFDGGANWQLSDNITTSLGPYEIFVRVRSNPSCLDSADYFLTSNSQAVLDTVLTSPEGCNGLGSMIIFAQPSAFNQYFYQPVGSPPVPPSVKSPDDGQFQVNGLIAGDYKVWVSNGSATCPADTQFVTIGLEPGLNITRLDTSDLGCGNNVARIEIEVSDPNTDFSLISTANPSVPLDFNTTGIFDINTAGTYQIIVTSLTNIGCSESTNPFTVAVLQEPTINLVNSSTSPAGCGNQNGTLNLEVNAENPLFIIDNTPVLAPAMAINPGVWQVSIPIGSGLHNIVVGEVTNEMCFAEDIVMVDSVSFPIIDTIIAQPTCLSGSPEFVVLLDTSNVFSDPDLMEYSLDGITYQSDSNFTAQNGQSYTISVRNIAQNSCVTTETYSFEEISFPAPEISILQDCNPGADDGEIRISIPNPDDYNFNIGRGPQEDTFFTRVATGMYNVNIRLDANPTCDTTITVEVPLINTPDFAASPPPNFSAAKCPGANDGEISIRADRLDSVVYTLYDAAFNIVDTSHIGDFDSLSPGDYSVFLSPLNAMHCVRPLNGIQIGEADGPLFDTLITIADTCGQGLGEVTVEPEDPVNIQYKFALNTPSIPDNFLTNLVGGDSLFIELIDLANTFCRVDTVIEIPDFKNRVITDTIIDQPSCGQNDGRIEIVSPFGTMADYLIRAPIVDITAPTQDMLGEGDYTLIASFGSCSDTIITRLMDPGAPIIDVLDPTNSCFGFNSGSAHITFDQTQNWEVEWSADTNITGDSIANLAPGIYTVTLTDAAGTCSTTDTFTILEEPSFGISPIVSEPNSTASNDGSIDLQIADPLADYNFLWNTGDTTEDLSNLGPGNYSVTITNQSGCDTSLAFQLNTCFIPTFNLVTAHLSCDNDSSGGIQVVSDSFLNITWPSSFTNVNGMQAANVSEGFYQIQIEFNGCSITEFTEVRNDQDFSVDCRIDADDNLLVDVIGSIGPYTVIVSDSILNPTTLTTDDSLINLGVFDPGIYRIEAITAGGCREECVADIPDAECNLVIDATVISGGCSDAFGSIILKNLDPTMFALDWNIDAYDGLDTLRDLPSGDYTVNVFSPADGCSQQATFQISSSGIVGIDRSIINPSCNQSTGLFQLQRINGGSGPYTISLDGLAIGLTEQVSLDTGMHVLRVEDADGCEFVDSFNIRNFSPSDIAGLRDTTLFRGEEHQFSIDPLLSDRFTTIRWFTNDSVICTGCSEITVRPDRTTTYAVLLIDDAGCRYEFQVRIAVDQRRPFFIANAFTPNGDNTNDAFVLYDAKDLVERISALRVYNYLGQLVYALNDFPPNEIAPNFEDTFQEVIGTAVFIYTLDIDFKANYSQRYTGDFTIIH